MVCKKCNNPLSESDGVFCQNCMTLNEKDSNINKIDYKYFYDFGEVGVEEKQLTSIDDLTSQFNYFKQIQDEENDKIGPVLNLRVEPSINGVKSMGAFHYINKTLFTKKIKKNEFMVCITKINEYDTEDMWLYCTENINEVSEIYSDFIEKQITPNINDESWSKNIFY